MSQLQLMQFATHIPQLEEAITRYLNAARDTRHCKRIEQLANQLTLVSKRHGFLEAAFQMLMSVSAGKESDMLLSSLIKDKFKYDFESVDCSQLQEYYNYLCQIACMPRIINTTAGKNICLALAYIYINLTSLQVVPLDNFLQPFEPSSPATSAHYNCYFRVLKYIALELDNTRMVVDSTSREIAKKRAIEQQQAVLEMLNEKCLPQMGSKLGLIILECFTTWIDLNYNASLFNSLPLHCLMDCLFQNLLNTNDEICTSAAEGIHTIIAQIRDQVENAPMITYLGINLVPLIPHIEHFLDMKDTEQAQILIRLILQFCEKALNIFANPAPEAVHFLYQLVHLTRTPNLDIFKDYASFWNELLEEAMKVSPPSIQFPHQNELRALDGVFLALYDALCDRCRYTPNLISKLEHHSESDVAQEGRQGELIYGRRGECPDMFEQLANYLTHQRYLSNACNKIRGLATATIKGENFWGNLEAIIFSLIYPLKKLKFINQDVSLIINTYSEVTQCDAAPIILKKSFLKLFKGLMNNQQKDEMFIKQLFSYSSTCFDEKLLTDQAEKVFCRGCQLNARMMVPDLPEFMRLIQIYPHREYIVRGVFYILCSHPQAIECYLLDALIAIRDGVEDSRCDERARRMRMVTLISICKFLKDTKAIQNHLNIVKEFVRRSIPFIKRKLTSCQPKDEDQNAEVQRAVKMMKYLMRCLRLQFWQFVPEIYECAMNSFRNMPICSYVYLVEIAITVFAKQLCYEGYLLGLYSQFCEFSIRHLQAVNFERYSYLLDDFMGMNKRFFIFNASIVLKSNQLPILIDHCIEYLSNDNPRIARATYTFFETIFMTYWPIEFINEYNSNSENESFKFIEEDLPLYELLKEHLRDKVHYIMAKMLCKLEQNPNDSIRGCIFDAVFAELKAFPEWNTEIWSQLISPLANDILLTREKEDFMSYVDQTNEKDIFVVKRAQDSLQKLIITISKRTITSSKRKSYDIEE